MGTDRATTTQLKRFAQAFKDAKARGANESDTVMFLVKCFEDLLGYDSLNGEISKELAIRDRYCDIAIKVDGSVQFLVEAKGANQERLSSKFIEQAENYASRQGIQWVVLTNGIDWQLYHLTFAEGEGIQHELAFSVNLLEGVEKDVDGLWYCLGLLHRDNVRKKGLEEYWQHKKSLSPSAVVKVLFSESVLGSIRRELNRDAPARLELEDVFKAVRDVLSKEALAEGGDLSIRKKRKRRRKLTKTDPTTGATTTEEIDEDEPDAEASAPAAAAPTP
jgi:hypothetical protein